MNFSSKHKLQRLLALLYGLARAIICHVIYADKSISCLLIYIYIADLMKTGSFPRILICL